MAWAASGLPITQAEIELKPYEEALARIIAGVQKELHTWLDPYIKAQQAEEHEETKGCGYLEDAQSCESPMTKRLGGIFISLVKWPKSVCTRTMRHWV